MTTSGPALLLIEDDDESRRYVSNYLRRRGYRVNEAVDGAAAIRLWDAHRADLILLDLGLPDMDGAEIIRRIRRESTVPVIIVSARGEERDRIAGLESGADDYLTKPFSIDELNARVRAVLRRASGPASDGDGRLSIGPIALDPVAHEVSVAGTPVHLTPREYELLKVLLGQAGRLVTKGRLLRAVWGVAYTDESHYVHVYVNRLRRKLALADPSGAAEEIIATEPGVGYRVVVPEVRVPHDRRSPSETRD